MFNAISVFTLCAELQELKHLLCTDGAWSWLSPSHPEDPSAWSRDAGGGAPLCQCQAVPPHPEEETGTGQAGSRGKNPQREKGEDKTQIFCSVRIPPGLENEGWNLGVARFCSGFVVVVSELHQR